MWPPLSVALWILKMPTTDRRHDIEITYYNDMIVRIVFTCIFLLVLGIVHGRDAGKVEISSFSLEDQFKKFTELSQRARQSHNHEAALRYHERMLSMYEAMGSEVKPTKILLMYTEIVTDLKLMRNFTDGLERIEVLKKKMKSLNALKMYPDMPSFISKLEANLLQCKSDYRGAVVKSHLGINHLLHKMLKKPHVRANLSMDDLFDLSEYRLLLQRSRVHLNDAPDSSQLNETALKKLELEKVWLESRAENVTRYLMLNGPWKTHLQMPRNFNPSLSSFPWYIPSMTHGHGRVITPDVNVQSEDTRYEITNNLYSFITPFLTHLESISSDLLSDYYKYLFKNSSLMRTDQDCIQESGIGTWGRFEITSIANELDERGCASSVAPTACKWLEHVRKSFHFIHIARAGYSVVQPNTWIKPHFGSTNEKLKIHVGLSIPNPSLSHEPCTWFRVGNITHTWKNHSVIMFDDSYEHEVRNTCQQERVVFQIVFRHLDLPFVSEEVRLQKKIVIDGH
jgi:Aspartyl/Asparaginyl beta-hydroxylase